MTVEAFAVAIILALLAQTFALVRFSGEVKQSLRDHDRRLEHLEGGT